VTDVCAAAIAQKRARIKERGNLFIIVLLRKIVLKGLRGMGEKCIRAEQKGKGKVLVRNS